MSSKIYVWDPLVRIFHWGLVLAFAISYFSGDEEELLHIYAGYVVLGLVVFRIFWGLVGSQHARFSDFLCSPGQAVAYMKGLASGKTKNYLGHNPAGAWMILLLLVSLILTSISGLEVYGLEGGGPLAQTTRQRDGTGVQLSEWMSAQVPQHTVLDNDDVPKGTKVSQRESGEESEDEEFWEETHEFFANFTVLLILFHVAGVVVSSRRHGQNLVKAMITGYKSQ